MLKLKVYKERGNLSGAGRYLPWRWAVLDTEKGGGYAHIGRWFWPPRAEIDRGRAPDGETALRIGLHALAQAYRDQQ